MAERSSWLRARLGDVLPLEYGRALPAKQRRHGAVPVVSSSGITGTHDEALVEDAAVVVGRKGNVGAVYYLEGPSWPIDTVFYTMGGPGIDLKYAYYMLMVLDLSRLSRDSAVPGLNRSEYSRINVVLPSMAQQRAIAEVLGALDDKIASNVKLANAADRLSHASFTALPKAESVPLSSVAQFVNGKAFTRNATGTGRVVVRIAELNSGIGNSTVYNDIEVPDQHLARPGDILFAWSGSLTLHRWYRDEAIVNQHIFKVVPYEGYPAWLIWGLISAKLEEFRAIAADKATTMGHIQRRHLDEPVPVPTTEVMAQNDAVMTALWKRALAAERENLVLAAIRDALLSGLMSGKLRVRDAERVAEEVA